METWTDPAMAQLIMIGFGMTFPVDDPGMASRARISGPDFAQA
jgi:hypothetical protein